jgi:DNA-binding NtrC family response regulator
MNQAPECGKRETVLLIDDDPMTTELFGEILAEKCDIRMANNVDAAMKIVNEESIAVVISDYHIGRGGAEALFTWMRAEHLELAHRFILLTGDKVADLSLFEQKATVLFKPVRIEILLEAVTQMLVSPQESLQ